MCATSCDVIMVESPPPLTLQDIRASPSRFQRRVECGIVTHTHQRLAEIAALQHGSERFRRLLKPGPQVFFIFHLTSADPLGHLLEKPCLMLVDEVAHM